MGGIYRIFLNENQSRQKVLQDFAHELGHILRHEGHQQAMFEQFRIYQEWQAKQFAYHFCIPTFLLNELELPQLRCEAVWVIAKTFNVELTFAAERLEKWFQNRRDNLTVTY